MEIDLNNRELKIHQMVSILKRKDELEIGQIKDMQQDLNQGKEQQDFNQGKKEPQQPPEEVKLVESSS